VGGRFLVFEGIDGSGKSSQVARLVARLQAEGREVVTTLEPTHQGHGAEIRRRAQHGPPMSAREELDLFLADRRENVSGNVVPALEAGRDVVQDRYFFSTAAYQAARPELGLSPDEVVALHDWAPRPDLVLLLDLPVDVGLGRVAQRGAEDAFEETGRQERVRATFHALAERDPTFRVIDATQDVDAVAEAVWREVAPLLESA
jgi:dTMP kinase